jgi:hypothetical protein
LAFAWLSAKRKPRESQGKAKRKPRESQEKDPLSWCRCCFAYSPFSCRVLCLLGVVVVSSLWRRCVVVGPLLLAACCSSGLAFTPSETCTFALPFSWRESTAGRLLRGLSRVFLVSFTCLSRVFHVPFTCLSRAFHVPFTCLSRAFLVSALRLRFLVSSPKRESPVFCRLVVCRLVVCRLLGFLAVERVLPSRGSRQTHEEKTRKCKQKAKRTHNAKSAEQKCKHPARHDKRRKVPNYGVQGV